MIRGHDNHPLSADHLVWGVPDLEAGVSQFRELTGVNPVFGGRHATGTANYLVGLGNGAYLEIIGILGDERGNGVPQPFELENLTQPRLVTWCLRSHDIASDVELAAAAGVDLGEIVSLSRQNPAGEILAWQMTRKRPMPRQGVLPFLIDWGTTPHPSERDLPSLTLAHFSVQTHEPDDLRRELDVLAQDVPITAGDPGLTAHLQTPLGSVQLS
jgi:hypothetical protein